jgi:hypothetical protein
MKACKRCKHSVYTKQLDGTEIYFCAILPPKDVIVEGTLQWIRPPMRGDGWCGQFKLGLLRLIFGHGSA